MKIKYGNYLIYGILRFINSGFKGRIILLKSDSSRAGFTTWYILNGNAYSYTSFPKGNMHKYFFKGVERTIKIEVLLKTLKDEQKQRIFRVKG